MPLGGVGTGNLCLSGDGSLRQWQIHNKVNHLGYVPFGFFALRWRRPDGRVDACVLQTKRFWADDGFVPPPTSSDHVVPAELKKTLGSLNFATDSQFRAGYPVAELELDMPEGCPFGVHMRAWSPLVPENAFDSAWPVAIFEITVVNQGEGNEPFAVLASLQNAVGWNGASLILDSETNGYGGNVNQPIPDGILLSNLSLDGDHPSWGEMALACLDQEPDRCLAYTGAGELWRMFLSGTLGEARQPGASPKGSTWNSAIAVSGTVKAGESWTRTFAIAWHFPNRYVDWGQIESVVPAGKSRFYLGNKYASRGGIAGWLPELKSRLPELRERTLRYAEITGVGLPDSARDAVLSNVANLRTNVCLWTEDGRFYGFEGGHGASTWLGEHGIGGCCPMNCTHVWNYEQALVELWPELFQSMRDTDWNVNLSPSGKLPHRVSLPVYVKKYWDVVIGGPDNPALDGLFAAVLKSYQLARKIGPEWLGSVWPQMKRAMDAVVALADEQGVINGEQPNTYDIHLYGPNTFIGSQFLAALLAMSRSAGMLGEDGSGFWGLFELGSQNYDRICFNGEYFVQRVPEGCNEPYQFENGCATDQLLGQWWAHHLGLGYVLPQEHVRSAVQAIMRRNFRTGLEGFKQETRIFASDHDSGLLVCTYEPGQRREVPLAYSDEVWTGLEYEFAALCAYEGMPDEALQVIDAARARYDGRERNPFNEIECGDHYIRALSSWSLPSAFASQQHP